MILRSLFLFLFGWTLLSVSAAQSLAQGVRAETDNFVLLSDVEIEAEPILRDLEAFRLAVLTDLDLSVSDEADPLKLNIVDEPDVFNAVSPGGISAAVYLQSAVGNDIVVGYSSDPDHLLAQALDPAWLRLVLRHEVVHHLIETRYPRKLPLWLNEGLAEYYATYRMNEVGQISFGQAFSEQEKLPETSDWLPMRLVVESLSRYPDYGTRNPERLFRAQRLYYSQSWALAHFVLDQPDGLAAIHRFIDGWDRDGDSEDSFETEFGLGYGSLEERVRERQAADAPRLRSMAPLTLPDIVISETMRTGTDKSRNHLRLLRQHGHMTDRVYDQIEALADRTEVTDTDVASLLSIAMRAWRDKDWEWADQYADRALAIEPTHAGAHKLKAKTAYGRVSENQMRPNIWSEAEATIRTSLRYAPDSAETHLFHVAVSLPDRNGISISALRSLDWLENSEAHRKWPHDSLMMIPALIYESRLEHADDVLETAERWTRSDSDLFVIDRLKKNVALERDLQNP